MYRLTQDVDVILREDGTAIPRGHRWWDDYEAWLAEGNTPEPAVEQTTVLKTQFTSLEFLDRFTDAEQLGVVSATLSSAQVKLWYDKMLAASFVDLNDPRTSAGLEALVTAGLLSATRKSVILTPDVV